MSDAQVFVSYSRQDRDRVEPLVRALSAAGLRVWYDAGLQAGDAYDSKIMAALQAAKAVVVVWSRASVDSQWVRAEATEGRALDKLVACQLEPCRPYPPFNLVHTEDLSGFAGNPTDPSFQRLLAAVRAKVEGRAGPVPPPVFGMAPAAKARRRGVPAWLWGALALGAAAVTAVGYLSLDTPTRPVSTDVATAVAVPPILEMRTPPADLASLQSIEIPVSFAAGQGGPDVATLRMIQDNLLKIGGAEAVRWVEISGPDDGKGRTLALLGVLDDMGVPRAANPFVTTDLSAGWVSDADPATTLTLVAYGVPRGGAAPAPAAAPAASPAPQYTVVERTVERTLLAQPGAAGLSATNQQLLNQAISTVGRGQLVQIIATGYFNPQDDPGGEVNRRRMRALRDILMGDYGVPADLIILDERRDNGQPRVELSIRYRPER